MPDHRSRPQLRYVDAFPIEENNDTYFVVRDPLEISPSPLVMSPLEFYIINFFDGQHSISEIKLELAQRMGGLLVTDDQIEKLISVMDNNFYLIGPRFEAHTQKIMDEFHHSPVRKAWHAGTAYPENPDELTAQITDFYQPPQGAGLLNGTLPGQSANLSKSKEDWQIQAILVPHIDLRVGGTSYTHAYKPLLENCQADLFIILGVAHYGGNGFFTTTAKDFETPLGTVKTDKEFLNQWRNSAATNLNLEEWTHRIEHSIEFQLPFLQHGVKHPFEIVPVLCGSVEPYIDDGKKLSDAPEVTALIESLRKTVQASNKRIAFILSVDLAHMGPKFGDEFDITKQKAEEIREADYKMFDILARMDIDQFHDIMVADLLPRKVDACSAAFTLLSLVKNGEGELVNYDQNFQPETNSIVSYGSMVFWGPGI